MAGEWKKTNYPGVRFREHATRKNGVKRDQYFVISYRLDGKRKDEALGWATKGWSAKKANGILSEIMENQRKGSGPQTLAEMRGIEADRRKTEQAKAREQKKLDLTFDEFFQSTYLPTTRLHKKARTVDNEKSLYLKWIKPELGHLPYGKIKAFNLEKVKKNMVAAGMAPRSIQYILALIRQAWNFARANRITLEPFPKVKAPKFDNKRLRFFTQEEASSLLAELAKKSEQTHDIALLSLHTGARAGEIFSLTWGAVDLENSVLTAKDTKSGKTRFLYLTKVAEAVLKARFENQPPNELVFKDGNGRKLVRISKTFSRAIEDLEFNSGIEDRRDRASFHTLRHTFASWHVQNGTDLYTVKELLGHSTIQLTERYSHLRPDGLKQAAKIFEKMIQKPGAAEPTKIMNIG